jgi:multiple sugar transport system substrate-binding protein
VGTTGTLTRNLSRALACVALCLPFGCGGGRGDAVEFWAMGREGEVVAQLMPEFERAHPGVRVRVQQIPWGAAHEKLLTAFVGEAMPDVFQAGNTWLPELATLGALEKLDERVARSTAVRTDDYFPGILEPNVIDGVTYGVPWYVDTRLLFYRSDILDEDPPRTWGDWMGAMGRVKDKVGRDRFAILLPLREWQPPVILALQLGASLLRDGERWGNFKSPEFRTAFGFYLSMFRRGLAPGADASQVTNVYQDFARGWFTFYLTGPWNIGEFATRLPSELKDKWATAPLPSPDANYPGVSLAGGASLAVFHGSPRKDAAWALVEYLSEPAQQVRFYRLTGDLPARKSAWDDEALAQNPRTRAFWTQLQAVRSTPKIPEWERIANKITHHAERAIRGDVTADAAVAELDRDVDAILEKRRSLLEKGH